MASAYRRQVSEDCWRTQQARHAVFISEEVSAKLSHPEFQRSRAALALVSDIPVLMISDDVLGLARILIGEKVVPGPVAGDAVHLAVATAHSVDYLFTWNVRHLANPNKLEHLGKICRRVGVVPPLIVTPDLLWESDK